MKTSIATRDLGLDAELDQLDGGYIRVYSGAQEAHPEDAIAGGQVLLAELRFGNPAFNAAAGGAKAVNPVTGDSSANAAGIAGWFRALKSDGTTVVHQGSVGTSGTDMVINSTQIRVNADVEVLSYGVTRPEGT